MSHVDWLCVKSSTITRADGDPIPKNVPLHEVAQLNIVKDGVHYLTIAGDGTIVIEPEANFVAVKLFKYNEGELVELMSLLNTAGTICFNNNFGPNTFLRIDIKAEKVKVDIAWLPLNEIAV